jgi:hypothetical protein
VKRNKLVFLGGAAALALCCLSTTLVLADKPDTEPNGKRIGTTENHPGGDASANSGGGSPTVSNGISYHGGPVLVAGSNIYYIWYGNWGTNTAKTILPSVANGLGGTPYFNINTTYYNSAATHVKNAAHFVAQYTWTTTAYGTALTDSLVQTIVTATINGGHLAYDPNGIYFVLTSPEVTEGAGTAVAFCKTYCGWHTHFALNNLATADVKYSFVGNASTQCPSSCMAQASSSPNNNPGADGMANVLVHELAEATNDPDLNAWYDSNGNESADKCAWQFGTELTASNKSKYNLTLLNGLQVLLQENWINAAGGNCALSY